MDSKLKSERSITFNLYRQLLRGYRIPIYRQLFASIVTMLVILESRRRGVQFPSRVTGGWWWAWRWRWEFLNQWLEYDTVQWCKKLIEPGMLVVDVGAHIGYFTCLFSELVGESGKVIAFEPNPDNYQLLLHNIKAHKCTAVEPVPKAVSDSRGELRLFLGKGHSTHSLIRGYYQNTEESINVETVTLDAYLTAIGNPRVGLIKIDAEGAEPYILAGMEETILKNPDLIIIIELNSKALQAAGHTPEELIANLEAKGFIPKQIKGNRELGPPLENLSIDDLPPNLLCLMDRNISQIKRI